MPHSPRWYRGRLWLTNAGTGELVTVDPVTGTWEPFCFCPGFVRGLTFFGDYAIVGSSKPREGDIYSGLQLDDRLAAAGQPPRLGLFIIDLRTAQIVQWLFIDGEARELYDVVVLPGVRQPMALGLQTDEVEKTIWFDPESIAGRRDVMVAP